MEIGIEKTNKTELSENKDKPNNNREAKIMKDKETNVIYDHLNVGPHTVAVTANNRRATNTLTMGKFLKVNKVPGVLEINK
jgi:hypothetical protein